MAPSTEEFTGRRVLMPEDFSPSADDVVIGRGRSIIARNKNFYKIIESELEAYSVAGNKSMKTPILARVLKHITEVVRGKFVKKDKSTGRWLLVEDSAARMTVAQAFRDALHTSYRSSKQSKQKRRRQIKASYTPPGSTTTLIRTVSCNTTDATGLSPSVSSPGKGSDEMANIWSPQLLLSRRDVVSSTDLPATDELLKMMASPPNTTIDSISIDGLDLLEEEDHQEGDLVGEEEDILESLPVHSMFSPSEIAAACGDDLMMSSSSLFFTPFNDNDICKSTSTSSTLLEPNHPDPQATANHGLETNQVCQVDGDNDDDEEDAMNILADLDLEVIRASLVVSI